MILYRFYQHGYDNSLENFSSSSSVNHAKFGSNHTGLLSQSLMGQETLVIWVGKGDLSVASYVDDLRCIFSKDKAPSGGEDQGFHFAVR